MDLGVRVTKSDSIYRYWCFTCELVNMWIYRYWRCFHDEKFKRCLWHLQNYLLHVSNNSDSCTCKCSLLHHLTLQFGCTAWKIPCNKTVMILCLQCKEKIAFETSMHTFFKNRFTTLSQRDKKQIWGQFISLVTVTQLWPIQDFKSELEQ